MRRLVFAYAALTAVNVARTFLPVAAASNHGDAEDIMNCIETMELRIQLGSDDDGRDVVVL